MSRGIALIEEPNTHPRMEAYYVFMSRDEAGQENVMGCLMGVLGMQPLATGNLRVLEAFKIEARRAAAELKGKQTIHLVRFSNREDIPF